MNNDARIIALLKSFSMQLYNDDLSSRLCVKDHITLGDYGDAAKSIEEIQGELDHIRALLTVRNGMAP
jgi:hypothetical protein